EILAGSDIIFAKFDVFVNGSDPSPHLKKGQQIELPTVVLFVLH
ncbi:unnamed protein product, partial [Allacma fusca]